MTSMVNLSWLPPIFAQASERLVGNLGELAGGATVWLAVTGLSRSGKTVFITSLIHNLLSSLHNPNRMPLLNVVGERRLFAAHLEAPRAGRLPQFPYLDNIQKMAVPDWPARTADLSEIGIEVRFAPANAVGRLLSEITGNPASLTIRIVDYPANGCSISRCWSKAMPTGRARRCSCCARASARDQRRVPRLSRAASGRGCRQRGGGEAGA